MSQADQPQAEPAQRFNLSTPAGRRRAERDLIWTDHGFLRAAFSNFYWIEEGVMARANQPSPQAIARYASMGIKTILNLRGSADTGYYALEREACAEHGLTMIDARMQSREPPSREQVRRAKELFESIEYPALMHCKSGADRAGAMAVLYKHLKMSAPIGEALEQLRLKYLHVRQGKTGMIDHFFETYLEAGAGKPFLQWVEEDYEKEAVKASFLSSWWGSLLVDRVLKRE